MSYTIAEIARALGAEADGDLSIRVDGAAEPDAAGPSRLALAMTPAFGEKLAEGKARAAVVWEGADWRSLGLEAAIFAPRSRYVLAGVSRVFDRPVDVASGVHPSSIVEDGVEIGPDASIGPFVHIAAGARIGARVRIVSHVSIGPEARVGDDALIFPHVHIGARVRIGDRFIALPGAVIGADGFSFVTPKPGVVEEARATGQITEASRTEGYVRINSMGSVSIGDDVEVGANACIDRGTVADTVVGDGCKLDDQVMVGHNVRLGKHCLLCGHSGVAGSTVVGDRVVLGGKAGIADHLTVGSDVVITGASGVSSNVPPGRIMMGNPAMRMDLMVESYKALRRLPRLFAKVEALQKRVSKDDAAG